MLKDFDTEVLYRVYKKHNPMLYVADMRIVDKIVQVTRKGVKRFH